MKKPFDKAIRYVENAERILRVADLEDGYYLDRQVIKRAGKEAYKGIELALKAFFNQQLSPSKQERMLEEIDGMLAIRFHSVYCTLLLSMGLDGCLLSTISQIGIKQAKEFIERIELVTSVRLSLQQLERGESFTHEEVKSKYISLGILQDHQ